MHDSDLQVLEALYAQPAAVTRVFSQDATTYIGNLSQSIVATSAKPKRAVIRVHLSYLASHLCPVVDAAVLEEVFYQVLFPFLLFSKPRQHTTELVWDIITQHLDGSKYSAVSGFELIGGVASIVKAAKDKAIDNAVDAMANINAAMSLKIARKL